MKRKAFRYALLVSFFILIVFSVAAFAFAHSGGTDSDGGHNSPDGYHYHHGYPPHQHPNGQCPYDFDDNVDHQERSSDKNASPNALDYEMPWYLWVLLAIFIVHGVFSIVMIIKNSRRY